MDTSKITKILFVRVDEPENYTKYTIEHVSENRRSIVATLNDTDLCPEDFPQGAREVAIQLANAANLFPELVAALEETINQLVECRQALQPESDGKGPTVQKAQAVLEKARE